jgi:hypothetical protein
VIFLFSPFSSSPLALSLWYPPFYPKTSIASPSFIVQISYICLIWALQQLQFILFHLSDNLKTSQPRFHSLSPHNNPDPVTETVVFSLIGVSRSLLVSTPRSLLSPSSSSSKQGLGKNTCYDFVFFSLFNSISSSDGLYLFFLLVDIVKWV